jgi:hypothetical protein
VEQLGSVFEQATPGPRGEDLRISVNVSRRALGAHEGVFVALPSELQAAEGMARWTPREGDPAGGVRLQLSPSFPLGGVIRLRGQGAAAAREGSPGDLYVEVRVVEEPGSLSPGWLWAGLAAGAAILALILV